MADPRLHSISFRSSGANDPGPTVVNTLAEFEACRSGSLARPAGDVRIFFKSDGSRYFINPLHAGTVFEKIKKFAHPMAKLLPSTSVMAWTFKGADDVKMQEFDALCGRHGVGHLLLKTGNKRCLQPHRVKEFLQLTSALNQQELQQCFLSFHHVGKKTSERDLDRHFVQRLFHLREELDLAESKQVVEDGNEHMSCSNKIQLHLNRRFGVSTRTTVAAELQGQGADEEDSDTERGRRRKSVRHASLLEDLGPLCTPQSKLMNSFGNIVVNTGNNSIVGGDGLPCMNVSPEAAKLIGYWDEASFHFKFNVITILKTL